MIRCVVLVLLTGSVRNSYKTIEHWSISVVNLQDCLIFTFAIQLVN